MSSKLFAIPTIGEKLCAHFGHCENFAIVKVENNEIVGEDFITPPVHEPGSYPKFLAEKGVSTIIAGGMGQKAKDIFSHNNIEIFMGVGSDEPKVLVKNYLNNQLVSGENLCDH